MLAGVGIGLGLISELSRARAGIGRGGGSAGARAASSAGRRVCAGADARGTERGGLCAQGAGRVGGEPAEGGGDCASPLVGEVDPFVLQDEPGVFSRSAWVDPAVFLGAPWWSWRGVPILRLIRCRFC